MSATLAAQIPAHFPTPQRTQEEQGWVYVGPGVRDSFAPMSLGSHRRHEDCGGCDTAVDLYVNFLTERVMAVIGIRGDDDSVTSSWAEADQDCYLSQALTRVLPGFVA